MKIWFVPCRSTRQPVPFRIRASVIAGLRELNDSRHSDSTTIGGKACPTIDHDPSGFPLRENEDEGHAIRSRPLLRRDARQPRGKPSTPSRTRKAANSFTSSATHRRSFQSFFELINNHPKSPQTTTRQSFEPKSCICIIHVHNRRDRHTTRATPRRSRPFAARNPARRPPTNGSRSHPFREGIAHALNFHTPPVALRA